MKKCVVVSDSFKGTLSSLEICRIASETVPHIFPQCQVLTIPVADGGEGTVACFMEAAGAVPVTVSVSGPYGENVQAVYAKIGGKAVVEMACAAGLPMVGERKNPEVTTTYGVGQVIRHAVESGCSEVLLGLGGSCTNDGGCGCAAALGVKFYDRTGREFVPVGQTLDQIGRMDLSEAKRLLEHVKLTAMCDVENPLFGPRGAACVFAPQKGADPAMIRRLDGQLQSLDASWKRELGLSLAEYAGAGAAGGMGAGCVAFLNAGLKSGIEAVLDLVEFDRCLEGADLVITGEGRIDGQSVQGKVISGVAKRTALQGIPLIAIVGGIADGAQSAYELGVTAMFGIDREAVAFDQYAHKCAENYRDTLSDILRLIRAFQR